MWNFQGSVIEYYQEQKWQQAANIIVKWVCDIKYGELELS